MRIVDVINQSRALPIEIKVPYCDRFACKLRGLTMRHSLAKNAGLLMVESSDTKVMSAIHMLFVFFQLGVIWVNASGKVVDVRIAMPWAPLIVPKAPACYILEIHPDMVSHFRVGDQIEFKEINA